MGTNVRQRNKYSSLAVGLLLAVALSSCVESFLPEQLDAFDKDASFTTTVYKPKLGRTSVTTSNFNAGNSTIPLTFRLTKVVHADGTSADELTTRYPVLVWQKPYLGNEKTLQEIEAKRGYEYRELFQVREHSGEVVMYANALSSFVRCQPDSGYVFDIRVSNNGGYKDFTGLRLEPEREADYEPNNIDMNTGIVTQDYTNPTTVNNMFIEGKTGYFGSMTTSDVRVYFRRNYEDTTSVNTLAFRFMDENYKPINPQKFSGTEWSKLIHGFNMEMTDEYVKYQVAYPIPLNDIPTDYTNADGDKARVRFKFDRIYFNNYRITANMDFEFAIYTPGHWEIIFVFVNGSPEFKDNA